MTTLARWQATITDDAGNIQPTASVEVRLESDGTLASLFTDRAGATPTGNPISADTSGFAYFHVTGGAYKITATKGAYQRIWRYVAIGTAAEADAGAALTVPDDAYASTWDGSTAVPTKNAIFDKIQSIGTPTQFRNIVGRNGGMEVWQRGAGSSSNIAVAASTTAYTADGWFLKTGANQACHVSAQAGLTNPSRCAAKIIRDSGQTGTGAILFEFPLDSDEVYRLRGAQILLHFVMKEGANQSFSHTVTYNLYCGTNGSPLKRAASAYTSESNPITGTVTTTTSAAQFKSSVSSAISAAVTVAALQFSITPSGTAGADDSVTIDDVQIEIITDGVAPAAPTFERSDFVSDIQRCMRHFRKSFDYATAPAQNVGINTAALTCAVFDTGGASIHRFGVMLQPPMRTDPSVTLYNPGAANAQLRDASASVDFTSSGVDVAHASWIGVYGFPTVAMAKGDSCQVHFTADAGI